MAVTQFVSLWIDDFNCQGVCPGQRVGDDVLEEGTLSGSRLHVLVRGGESTHNLFSDALLLVLTHELGMLDGLGLSPVRVVWVVLSVLFLSF